MRMIILSLGLSLTLVSGEGQLQGQPRPQPKLTAEQQKLLDKQKEDAEARKTSPGELTVAGMKLGAKGNPERIDAKVMQVIDGNQMLVGLEDARNGKSRYDTWVMVKCPTAGITDGKFWRGGQWKSVTGSADLEVTGTTTYKSADGGTKTVFVLEPVSERKPATPAAVGKSGAAAYDDFVDPVRELMIKEWEAELARCKHFFSIDEQRLRDAKTPAERQKLLKAWEEGKARVERVEKNDPPYINLEALKKKK